MSDNRQRREMAERMALNAPIQGSAADIIKVAMLDVEKALDDAGMQSRMLLQVHDELVFEVGPGEQEALEELVRTKMGRAVTLNVPLDVSVGMGCIETSLSLMLRFRNAHDSYIDARERSSHQEGYGRARVVVQGSGQ
jgi:hypothetical protein